MWTPITSAAWEDEMERPLSRSTRFVTSLWRADARLTATGLLMLVVLAPSVIGVLIDPRTITGAPSWLKPAKFATSIAIYSLTLTWIWTLLTGLMIWMTAAGRD